MNQLVPFSFESHEIRVVDQNGNSWFILRDLLEAMESKTTTTAAVESIKQGLGDGFVNDIPILDNLGREQNAIIVAESAATYLLSRSNTDKGRELNRFIHVDVLPSIRKTGSYSIVPKEVERPAIDASVHAVEAGVRLFGIANTFAANVLGLVGNQAMLSANQCVRKVVNIDVLSLLDQTHLIANPLGMTYNPTELGLLMNPERSARWVNLSIQEIEFQYKDATGKWVPTKKAEGYYEWVDTGKRKGDGTPVKQLKWFRSILEKIDPQMREAA